jgi:hypothetical protein
MIGRRKVSRGRLASYESFVTFMQPIHSVLVLCDSMCKPDNEQVRAWSMCSGCKLYILSSVPRLAHHSGAKGGWDKSAAGNVKEVACVHHRTSHNKVMYAHLESMISLERL